MNPEQLNPVSIMTFMSKENTGRCVLIVFDLLTFGVSPIRSEDLGVARSAFEANPEGCTNIMPPTDLKGWFRVPVPLEGKLGKAQWHVDTDKDLLVCDGEGGHDMLLMKKEYGNVIFHFEFRYTKVEGKQGYNSGVYVRNSKDGVVWHQAQFGDSSGGFLFGETPTTSGKRKFFNVKDEVISNRVKLAGQSNTIEITARGMMLTLWVNGAVTCRFDGCHVKSGHVGVEGEGCRIEFRNLQVKQLRVQ
ncbi:MAG: DUF1080 domain-containing protein [Pirellulales bacterium]